MVQCENEFGSYVSQRKDITLDEHRRYNAKIKQQLADAVGVSRQTINAIESGKFVPSTVLALKIARCFGKAVEAVFQLEEGD